MSSIRNFHCFSV